MRKYDSDLGRFTSIDPLWEEYRSLSPYHYCRNNPLILADPSGMADEDKKEKKKDETKVTVGAVSPGVTVQTENKVELSAGLQGQAGIFGQFGPLGINLGSVDTDGNTTRGISCVLSYQESYSKVKIEWKNNEVGVKQPYETQKKEESIGIVTVAVNVDIVKETTISKNMVTEKRDTSIQKFMAFGTGASVGAGVGGSANAKAKIPISPGYDRTNIVPFSATIHVPDSQVKLKVSDSSK